ncbi:H(+)/Cl(-) exchange transporter 6-like [Dreissena polymorpha]|uniref:H(+)/Cl(-) exchange transporter 6-like n=1 Tax=Dreissena polymorpha TaxID=45954 RepID=UPI0022650CF2|nr:H(+)/Cl(-) exchange transporter 6-like [Dreissena polymorpha]
METCIKCLRRVTRVFPRVLTSQRLRYGDDQTEIVESNSIDSSNTQSKSRHSTNNGHNDSDLPRKDFESLDYDVCYNKPYEHYVENQRKDFSFSKIEVIKWMITFLIGFSTGLVAFFIDTIVKLLSKLKFNPVTQMYPLKDMCD